MRSRRLLGLGAVALLALLVGCSGGSPQDSPSADYLAGRDIFGTCAACHGAEGAGGVGPALASVRLTFPTCDEHVSWIELGSEGWRASVGTTYGAPAKPVNGGMPSFAGLSPLERQQVAYYERVRFGDADPDVEAAACGLEP